MNDERQHPGSGGETNSAVSRAYSELADERLPERLNKAVLKRAAAANRPSYSRSIQWTRPLAWAATIAICLAITLQVARVPISESVTYELPAAPPADQPALIEPLENAPRESSDAAFDAPEQIELHQDIAQPVPTRPQAEKRVHEPSQGSLPGLAEEASPSSVAEFEMRDADMLRRAEELARMQSGDNKKSAQEFRTIATVDEVAASSAEQPCSEEATSQPVSWIECITKLEAVGLHEQARREREALSATFPDFEE